MHVDGFTSGVPWNQNWTPDKEYVVDVAAFNYTGVGVYEFLDIIGQAIWISKDGNEVDYVDFTLQLTDGGLEPEKQLGT